MFTAAPRGTTSGVGAVTVRVGTIDHQHRYLGGNETVDVAVVTACAPYLHVERVPDARDARFITGNARTDTSKIQDVSVDGIAMEVGGATGERSLTIIATCI